MAPSHVAVTMPSRSPLTGAGVHRNPQQKWLAPSLGCLIVQADGWEGYLHDVLLRAELVDPMQHVRPGGTLH